MHSAYCACRFAVRDFSDALLQKVAYFGNNIRAACDFSMGVKAAIAQRAQRVLHAKSESTPGPRK
jgi:NADP-dependent 3-hydroxy acid dehydrogenase YdfG